MSKTQQNRYRLKSLSAAFAYVSEVLSYPLTCSGRRTDLRIPIVCGMAGLTKAQQSTNITNGNREA